MKDRLKLLRKTLGLNQVDFGTRIGIGGTAISKFESGVNAISDTLVLLVCREFNVNEAWLRNGTGEMFTHTSNDLVAELSETYHLGTYGEQLLATYLQLSDADKRAVERFVSQLTANVQKAEDAQSDACEKEKDVAEESFTVKLCGTCKQETAPVHCTRAVLRCTSN